jgi:hypothetical protein
VSKQCDDSQADKLRRQSPPASLDQPVEGRLNPNRMHFADKPEVSRGMKDGGREKRDASGRGKPPSVFHGGIVVLDGAFRKLLFESLCAFFLYPHASGLGSIWQSA